MTIERCRQCDDDGWGLCRREGRCIIEDDFAGLVDKIARADAVVFSTPVYFSDLSESMKAFLDRLRRTCIQETGPRSREQETRRGSLRRWWRWRRRSIMLYYPRQNLGNLRLRVYRHDSRQASEPGGQAPKTPQRRRMAGFEITGTGYSCSILVPLQIRCSEVH